MGRSAKDRADFGSRPGKRSRFLRELLHEGFFAQKNCFVPACPVKRQLFPVDRARFSGELGFEHLIDDHVQGSRDVPRGIVRPQLGEVGYVADVVATPILVPVRPIDFLVDLIFDQGDALQHRGAVRSATAQVIDFAWPWFSRKSLKGAYHVIAVNLVTHLFAFVAKYSVLLIIDRDLDKVREKAV